MRDNRTVIILVVLVLAGLLTGALFFGKHFRTGKSQPEQQNLKETPQEEFTYLKVFFPVGGRLQIFEKRIPGRLTQTKLTEVLVQEFLNLNSEMNTGIIPAKVKLLDAYISNEGVLYLNFPSALASGFRADVMDEYLFLKGLLDTMISNLTIDDVVILIGGREVESLGGHFFVNRPLKKSLYITLP